MKTTNNIRKLILCMVALLPLYLLSGCGATEKTTEAPECRPAESKTCEAQDAQDEKDRGYDPCLINKNLPVCKS